MTDESMLADVRTFMSQGLGECAISTRLGVTRHRARQLVLDVTTEGSRNALAIIRPNGVPALSFYDTARQALAQAKTLAEVKTIADKGAALREFARRARDRQMQIDAQEIIIRAERELGARLADMPEVRGTRGGRGRPKIESSETELSIASPTLADIGIDKKLSSRAQKLASISERAIETRIANWREHALRGHDRVTADILKQKTGDRPRARNRSELDDSLDYFPTPPWATRALMDHVLAGRFLSPLPSAKIWEPACGEGHMALILEEYSRGVFASDIHDYCGNNIRDFLTVEVIPEFHWIITNPPFKKDMAERFVLRALDLAREGVAMLVSIHFLESVGRYKRIFKDRPPTLIAFFAERVPICKGRWDPDASSDAAYCWLVWIKDRAPQAPYWIPPGCRESLTKQDDRKRFAAWLQNENEVAE